MEYVDQVAQEIKRLISHDARLGLVYVPSGRNHDLDGTEPSIKEYEWTLNANLGPAGERVILTQQKRLDQILQFAEKHVK